MSLGEFDTAVRYRLPIVFVVYNDERVEQERRCTSCGCSGDRTVSRCSQFRRWTEWLERSGVKGMAVGALADLEPLAERLRTLDGPILLDCRISRDVRAVWLQEAFERGSH